MLNIYFCTTLKDIIQFRIYGYIVVCNKQIMSKHVYLSKPYKTIKCYMFNTTPMLTQAWLYFE